MSNTSPIKNKFKRYVHGAESNIPTHKNPKTSPLQLTPVQRRAQARVKLRHAKKDRISYLNKLKKDGFRSPEHFARFEATKKRAKRKDGASLYSWNDADPDIVSAPQQTIAEKRQQDNQDKELDEVEVLDTMQLEFLDRQQQEYVDIRETKITMFKRIYEMMEEDYRSQIVKVQREAANMRLEMKEVLKKRTNGLDDYTASNEKGLKEFDAWYEDIVKVYAIFTEKRIEDWEKICTIQHKYRNECIRKNVSCSESLVNGLGNEILSIKHYGLGDKGADVFLSTCIRPNQFLCILDLSDNFLTDTMAFTLARAITPLSHARTQQIKKQQELEGSSMTPPSTANSNRSNNSRGSNRNKMGKKGRKSNSRSASDKYRVKMKELKAERERKNLEEKEKKMINNTEPLLSCLRSINLSKNLITGAGFSSIIAACSGVNWHPQLHGVQAMENKFNGRAMKTKLGHMISSSVLNRKCPLEILNMSYNNIGDHPEAEFSIEIFLSSDRSSLTKIDLSYNELGGKVGASLGKALRLNRTLKECNLRWNDLAGVAKSIFNGLRDNGALVSIDLSFSSVGNKDVETLAKVLSFATSRLVAINLADNAIGPKGCRSLCRVLQNTNKRVKLLDLTGNPVEEAGIIAVSNMLKANDTLVYIGFDLTRAHVKLSHYDKLNHHPGPPGSPTGDKRVIKAINAVRNEPRVLQANGIESLNLYENAHVTTFTFAPKWIDGGDLITQSRYSPSNNSVSRGGNGTGNLNTTSLDTPNQGLYDGGNFETVRPSTAMSFASINSLNDSRPNTAQKSTISSTSFLAPQPLRLPFIRALHYDLRHTFVRDLRDSGDKERVPTYPKQPFLAAMVGHDQYWDQELDLCMFPAGLAGGPRIVRKQKGHYADEMDKYKCTVSVVGSIEGHGIRYSVKKFFMRPMETEVAPGSRLPSRETGGWKSKFVEEKKEPTIEESISMAVLVREDDYEEEYNKRDEEFEVDEDEDIDDNNALINLSAITAFKSFGHHTNTHENEVNPVIESNADIDGETNDDDDNLEGEVKPASDVLPIPNPGKVGLMRNFGLEFTWPCKYLPKVEVGSIVCFTFKQIERRKLANAPKEVKYIPGLLVNRIDRYGVVQVDMESLEKNSDDDEEEEEDTSSSRGRSRYGRGSTRGSSRK